jgi:hypothetical protein
MAGLGVVDAKAVEENEGLLEGGAAKGEVGLDAVAGAGLEVEGGVLTEEVYDAVGLEGLVAWGDDVDGAVAFGEGEGFDGGGYGDALGCGGLRGEGRRGLLCDGGAQAKQAEREMFLLEALRKHVAIIRLKGRDGELVLFCYK